MIPFYILGLLQRFGPQHGYQIKKILAEQLSDFTQIKLPTIYYHLEKMQKDGLLSANGEKAGSRPEKTIYTITNKGIDAFKNKIEGLLEFEYRPTFPSDGLFYFSDYIDTSLIKEHLRIYMEKLRAIIFNLQKHKNEILNFVPKEWETMVNIIFSHHEHHYQAELNWVEESLKKLS
jgi:DNA-binding PadR family transcriptional regulator